MIENKMKLFLENSIAENCAVIQAFKHPNGVTGQVGFRPQDIRRFEELGGDIDILTTCLEENIYETADGFSVEFAIAFKRYYNSKGVAIGWKVIEEKQPESADVYIIDGDNKRHHGLLNHEAIELRDALLTAFPID